MAEEEGATPATDEGRPTAARRFKIDHSSCFVDFAVLRTEYYTESGMELAKDYEPLEKRKIKNPVSDVAVCLHLLSACVGSGMLGLPMAFQCSGTVIGIIGTPLLGAITIYGFHVLLSNQYIQCKRLQAPFLTLPRSMKITFLNGPRCLRWLAPCSPYVVDFMLIVNQIGVGTANTIFVADSTKQLLEEVTNFTLDKRVYIAALFVPQLLMNFIRDLQKLMPVSLIGNLMRGGALLCIFYCIFFVGDWQIDNTVMAAPIEKLPIFLGTVIYALGAPAVVCSLHYNMGKPTHFLGCKGIFPWSMSCVTCVYLAVGLSGYLKYGITEKGSTIVSVLPSDFWLSKVVMAAYTLGLFCAYPLQMYIAMEIIWGNYVVKHIKNPDKECVFEFILRISTVLVTNIIALGIPNLHVVQSLVGAFCVGYIGFIMPFLSEIFTQWYEKEKRFNCVFFRDLVLTCFGIFVFVIGTYMILHDYITS